jgi:hypothetical protein
MIKNFLFALVVATAILAFCTAMGVEFAYGLIIALIVLVCGTFVTSNA